MTIANTKVLAKVVAAFAVAALALSAFAVSAQAQTTTTTTTTTASTCASFNRDLTVGATGADVTALQQWLISKGFTIAAGATGYFGGQTQAALARYQASVQITPAAGYFGPITRAKVNSVACGTTNPGTGGDDDDDDDDDDSDDDDDDDDDDNDDDNGPLEGGAGDLESADYTSSLNNEDVGENDEEVAIAGLDLEADGSDLGVTATRVTIVNTNDGGSTSSDDLDDYAESLAIWFDGEELDTVDVSDIDEDDGEYTHTFSFDWEDAIIREGETEELTLSVTALSNIDEEDLEDNTFEVYFETVRYVDAQDATVTEDSLDDIGSEGDNAGDEDEQEGREFSFTSFSEANDVELSISESDDSPEETTTEVDEGDDAEVVLLVGELEAEGADIEIQEISATITSTDSQVDLDNDELAGEMGEDATTENVASEYCLVIDGEEVDCVDSDEFNDEFTAGAAVTDIEEYTFDADDFVISDGDTVEFEIVAHLEDVDEGEVIVLEASVDETQVEAETEEDGEELDEDEGEINGSAEGEEQTFRSEGLSVDFDEDASEADQTGDNSATFEFVLDLKAFGVDGELDETDFTITIDGPVGGAVEDDRDLSSNDFDEDEDAAIETYEIDENEDGTVTFSVVISVDPAGTQDGFYEVTLESVNFDGAVTIVDESLTTQITAGND